MSMSATISKFAENDSILSACLKDKPVVEEGLRVGALEQQLLQQQPQTQPACDDAATPQPVSSLSVQDNDIAVLLAADVEGRVDLGKLSDDFFNDPQVCAARFRAARMQRSVSEDTALIVPPPVVARGTMRRSRFFLASQDPKFVAANPSHPAVQLLAARTSSAKDRNGRSDAITQAQREIALYIVANLSTFKNAPELNGHCVCVGKPADLTFDIPAEALQPLLGARTSGTFFVAQESGLRLGVEVLPNDQEVVSIVLQGPHGTTVADLLLVVTGRLSKEELRRCDLADEVRTCAVAEALAAKGVQSVSRQAAQSVGTKHSRWTMSGPYGVLKKLPGRISFRPCDGDTSNTAVTTASIIAIVGGNPSLACCINCGNKHKGACTGKFKVPQATYPPRAKQQSESGAPKPSADAEGFQQQRQKKGGKQKSTVSARSKEVVASTGGGLQQHASCSSNPFAALSADEVDDDNEEGKLLSSSPEAAQAKLGEMERPERGAQRERQSPKAQAAVSERRAHVTDSGTGAGDRGVQQPASAPLTALVAAEHRKVQAGKPAQHDTGGILVMRGGGATGGQADARAEGAAAAALTAPGAWTAAVVSQPDTGRPRPPPAPPQADARVTMHRPNTRSRASEGATCAPRPPLELSQADADEL